MFNEKVVLTVSNDKRHFLSNSFDLRKWYMEIIHSVCNRFGNFWQGTIQMKQPQPFLQIEVIKLLEKPMKPVEKPMNGLFKSIFVRWVKTMIYWAFSETFGNIQTSVFCGTEAWILIVNELQMLHLSIYLPPIFHPGFSRNDGVVVYVDESIKFEVVCTRANLSHKTNKAKINNNQCFVVVWMYISPPFTLSLILKLVELLLNDISNFLGSPIFFVGDMNNDPRKQNTFSSTFFQIYCSITE